MMNIYTGKIFLMTEFRNKIVKKGIPSFCTANFDVIEIIFKFAKINRFPILLESTSNQVNQDGGYTGLKPKNFKNKIYKIASEYRIKKQKLFLGGDHLGPLPWKRLKENKAMENAKELVKQYINAGFKKIHLDTAILCLNQKKISREEVVSRCTKLIKNIPKKKLNSIFFVVGTEVPAAGGGDNVKPIVTKMNNIKKDYLSYRKFISKFLSRKKQTFGLVIDPGIGFQNRTLTKSNFNKINQKKNFSLKNNFIFEAHSSDYQSLADLKKLCNKNFKFLKVGPELTYFFMRAILLMEKVERNIFFKNSNLKEVLLLQMDKNKKYWYKYYSKTKYDTEFLKLHSLLDRARYYWDNKKVRQSKKILFKNINSLKTTEFNFLFSLNSKEKKFKKKEKLSNVSFLLFQFLKNSLMKYYWACGYKINKQLY